MNNETNNVENSKINYEDVNDEINSKNELLEEDITIHQKWSKINEIKELFGFAY